MYDYNNYDYRYRQSSAYIYLLAIVNIYTCKFYYIPQELQLEPCMYSFFLLSCMYAAKGVQNLQKRFQLSPTDNILNSVVQVTSISQHLFPYIWLNDKIESCIQNMPNHFLIHCGINTQLFIAKTKTSYQQ